MLVNPEIQAWFDRLQGQQPGRGGGGGLGSGALPNYVPGIIYPGRGIFGFNAPPIVSRYVPRLPAPYPAQERPSGIPPAAPSPYGGGARDLGGAAKAAGYRALGAGIESGLKAIGEKNKQRQAHLAAADSMSNAVAPFGTPPAPPSRPETPTPPSRPEEPLPPSRPPDFSPAPLFAPVGVQSDVPIFAQPGGGATAPSPSIGQSASLPTFAQQPVVDDTERIRRSAAARGIDPDIAVRVARSEGLGATRPGDKGSSFGPFQLHYGGIASGGNAVPGLGDEFTRTTGLDARDPSTTQAQIDFALDQAAKGGWGPFHGAAKAGIGQWEGIGGRPTAPPASSVAYAAAPPASIASGARPQLAGPAPIGDYTEPRLISPGKPQTGPAYSDETWNNRPIYDYEGGAASVSVPPPPTPSAPSAPVAPQLNNSTAPSTPSTPVAPQLNNPAPYQIPGQQGMFDLGQGLAAALAQGEGMAPPAVDPTYLATALANWGSPPADAAPLPAFGGGFFGGLFG